MMQNKYFTVFLCLLLFFLIHCNKEYATYKAEQGVLDLRNWNPESEPVISLDGNWEFYWNRLLTLPELANNKQTPNYIHLPSTWNNKIIDGEKLEGSGFATFRLKVLLPDTKNLPTFAIRIKPLTNCKVFIDETELRCIGIIGTDASSSVPDTRPTFTSFSTKKDSLDIIIQVSNFHHKKGGFLYSVFFGTEQGLLKYVKNIRAKDNFILGFLLFAILYHIGLYIIRKSETLSIQFVFIIVCVFLRTASTGEKLLVDYIPVNHSIYVAIEYITFFMVMPLVIQFINNMFSMKIPKVIVQISYIIGIIFSGITIATDTSFYSNLVNIYLPVFIIELIVAYSLVVVAYYHKKENAIIILISFTFILITTINDILNTTEVFHTSYLAHYGLIFVIFGQSLFLLMRFVKAFKSIEILSADLKQINDDLENRIIERTREIMEEKIMAIKANELKDKFIALLSHDLRSPIGNAKMLIECSIDSDNESEKEMSRNYLKMAIESIDNSIEMTDRILQFSQTNSGNIEMNIQICFPSLLVDKVYNIMIGKVREKEIQLLNFVSEAESIETDEALLQEVILNLISNSIKFCNPGDMISVRSEVKEGLYFLYVKDTGIGIPKNMRANLFSQSIKTSSIGTSGESGTGLGLPLCQDIAKMLNGEIKLNETLEKGTEIIVSLPLRCDKPIEKENTQPE